MFDMWGSDLTPEETTELLQKAAQEIRRRKLETSAVFLLESHMPVLGVGGQAAMAFSPFLVPFLGFDNVNNYTRLLTKRENVDRLLEMLEEGVVAESTSTRELES